MQAGCLYGPVGTSGPKTRSIRSSPASSGRPAAANETTIEERNAIVGTLMVSILEREAAHGSGELMATILGPPRVGSKPAPCRESGGLTRHFRATTIRLAL